MKDVFLSELRIPESEVKPASLIADILGLKYNGGLCHVGIPQLSYTTRLVHERRVLLSRLEKFEYTLD